LTRRDHGSTFAARGDGWVCEKRVGQICKKRVGMSRIRVLQATGTRKPLYIFPGIGGTLDTFADLARRFSGERPVYGVKMIGTENECEPLREMQQLASTHAADIRMVQRHGPYFVFGYSFGGALAFEVARAVVTR
jgi:surfactin synthase thioesterase subunit